MQYFDSLCTIFLVDITWCHIFLSAEKHQEKETGQKQPLQWLTKYFLLRVFLQKGNVFCIPAMTDFKNRSQKVIVTYTKRKVLLVLQSMTSVSLPGCRSANDDLPVATPHSRSSWNCNIWYVKPFPSSPMRFLQGTLTSSKKIWAVSDDLIPSLSIFLATWMPEEKGVWERPQKTESLWTSTMFSERKFCRCECMFQDNSETYL